MLNATLIITILLLSCALWRVRRELKEAKEEAEAAAYMHAFLFGICQNFAISIAEGETGLKAKTEEFFLMITSKEDGAPNVYIRVPSRQTLTEFVMFRMHPEDPRAVCIGAFVNKEIIWANNCSEYIPGSKLSIADKKTLSDVLRELSNLGHQGIDAVRNQKEAQS